jgi:archaellum biogenesis ATPase FlaH
VNLGLEMVSSVLATGDISVFTECGFNTTWLSSPSSMVIFSSDETGSKDKAAYSWLLRHYSRHHSVPTTEMFRAQFPESSYKLQKDYIKPAELIDLVFDRVSSYQVADLITKSIALHDAGKITEAITLIKSTAVTLSPDAVNLSSGYDVTSPDFDIDKLLDTELEKGIPFGFDQVDDIYWGFHPGQLVTLLGRQKASKSWLTLNSAFHAWISGYSVLFFSVEMGEELLQQRLLCLGSGVSPGRMRRGLLYPGEKERVKEFQQTLSSNGQGRFIISRKKTLITLDDIAEEVSKYKPHIVYIDGFSFMVDRRTGRMTDDWQANENVAAELKSFAMDKDIVVFVNTQVQEKQYNSSRGIEARSIAGGTGLLKASDYVIGLDKDKETKIITLSSQRSRFEDFDDFHMDIDFDTMTFSIVEELLEEKMEAKGV